MLTTGILCLHHHGAPEHTATISGQNPGLEHERRHCPPWGP